MTRAILFDLFGTLVSGAARERREAATVMAAWLGVDPSSYDRAYDDSTVERYTGRLGDLAGTIRELAIRAGGTPSDDAVRRSAALRVELNRRLLVAAPPGALAALDTLRTAGWRTGVVSNCTAGTPDPWPESPLASRFDVVVFSCAVGLAKPNPAIFRYACQRLGSTPAGCVYVGDGSDGELAGAQALGMRTIRTTEHADSDPSWAGESVASLADLVDRLAR